MGLSYAHVELKNPRHPELQSITAAALADTGSLHLCIPEHYAVQLQLDQYGEKEVTIADGSRRVVPYMGPVQIGFAHRTGFCGALVFGDEVLIGAIPMEDMDRVVIPRDRRLAINPDNPNMACSKVK